MNPSHKWLLILAALMGFFSVAAGAFGAHALRSRLDREMLTVFEIGARYQMYHALAIGVVVCVSGALASSLLTLAAWLFMVGSLIFSGSLYALALSGLGMLGAVTPIGGVLLLAGWFCFALGVYRSL